MSKTNTLREWEEKKTKYFASQPEKKRKGNFKPEGAKMMKCHKAGCKFETWSNAYLDTHINKSKNQPRQHNKNIITKVYTYMN